MSNAFVNIINRGLIMLNLVFEEWMIRFPTETGGQSIKTMHNKWYHVLYESLQSNTCRWKIEQTSTSKWSTCAEYIWNLFSGMLSKGKKWVREKKKRVSLVSERNNNQQSYKDLWLISLCLLFFFFFFKFI